MNGAGDLFLRAARAAGPAPATATIPPRPPGPPTPLSPNDFAPVGATGNGGPLAPLGPIPPQPLAGDGTLSANDRVSLQAFLNLFRAARADLHSTDPKVARRADWQLVTLLGYLTGFLDAKGLWTSAPKNGGFMTLYTEHGRPDLDRMLDRLERSIAAALSGPDTRGGLKSALSTAGGLMQTVGQDMVVGGLLEEFVAPLLK